MKSEEYDLHLQNMPAYYAGSRDKGMTLFEFLTGRVDLDDELARKLTASWVPPPERAAEPPVRPGRPDEKKPQNPFRCPDCGGYLKALYGLDKMKYQWECIACGRQLERIKLISLRTLLVGSLWFAGALLLLYALAVAFDLVELQGSFLKKIPGLPCAMIGFAAGAIATFQLRYEVVCTQFPIGVTRLIYYERHPFWFSVEIIAWLLAAAFAVFWGAMILITQ